MSASQGYRVQNDDQEDQIFEGPRCDEPPNSVLESISWDVTSMRFSLQGKFDALPLVLVQLAVLVLALSLVLECDDNETDEDVHHEER